MSDWGGPYVTIAVIVPAVDDEDFVEIVTNDQGSTINVNKIMSRTAVASLPATIAFNIEIVFYTGSRRDQGEFVLTIVEPDGIPYPGSPVPFPFGSTDDEPQRFRFHMNMLIRQVGGYWFEITEEGRLVTKLPLQVDLMPEVPQAFRSALQNL